MKKVFRAKSTFEQWRILQAVVDAGSYAKAASLLNKSQSSLNHAVAKLQNQLGIQLLEVVGRNTQLTKAGEVMLRRSRKILGEVENLEILADTLDKGWEGEITIACEILYPKRDLHQILKTFLPDSRGSRMNIRTEVISGSEESIANKTADIVISNLVPKGYFGNTIISVNLIPVCGTCNIEFPKHLLSIDNLAEYLQIVIRDTGIAKNEMGWLKAEQRWTIDNFYEAIEILQTGVGFCWLPEHLAQKHIGSGELRKINIKGFTGRTAPLHLVIPDRDNQGPASKFLEQLFYQHHDIKYND